MKRFCFCARNAHTEYARWFIFVVIIIFKIKPIRCSVVDTLRWPRYSAYTKRFIRWLVCQSVGFFFYRCRCVVSLPFQFNVRFVDNTHSVIARARHQNQRMNLRVLCCCIHWHCNLIAAYARKYTPNEREIERKWEKKYTKKKNKIHS